MKHSTYQQVARVDQGDDNSEEDAETPAGAELRRAVEHAVEIRQAKRLLGVDHAGRRLLACEYDADRIIVPDNRSRCESCVRVWPRDLQLLGWELPMRAGRIWATCAYSGMLKS